ncbi:prepilin-type N-terminal cleavage/methylation domain-containing protein [Candidatus Poribacteria bacterium]
MIKLLNGQRGFTLIEVIVGYIVLTITALATCSAFVAGSQFNAKSEDRTIAANIAQLKMEEIKNTYYLSIVSVHPPGQTSFKNEPLGPPYWTPNTQGQWITALPEGKYEISYPGLDLAAGIVPDPLIVKVTISWLSDDMTSSLSLKTIYSMAPGRVIAN